MDFKSKKVSDRLGRYESQPEGVCVNRIVCKYASLAEVPRDLDVTSYLKYVEPQDYDFGLDFQVRYLVIGLVQRDCGLWFYVAPDVGDLELSIVPCVLFDIEDPILPFDSVVRLASASSNCLELVSARLASVEDWFERYLDGDIVAISAVNDVLNKMRGS